MPEVVSRSLRALLIALLLSTHAVAAFLASDCLQRCRHACCRVSHAKAAHGPHCTKAAAGGASCSVRGKCSHDLEVATTTLHEASLPTAIGLAPRAFVARPAATPAAAAAGVSSALDPPPPRA